MLLFLEPHFEHYCSVAEFKSSVSELDSVGLSLVGYATYYLSDLRQIT